MTPIPNTFQTPNEYVDRAMQYLGCDELRVLLFATRHILGWKDHIDERTAKISLTMFEKGFKTEKGAVFAGCGLSRPAIKNALDGLVEFGFLIKIGDAGNDGQEWKLGTEIDYPAMEDRSTKEVEKKRQKVSKAAKASGEKRRKGGTTDVPASSTTHVPPEQPDKWYDPRTASGTTDVPLGGTTDVPKQTHITNTPSNPQESAAPAQEIPVDPFVEKILEYFQHLPQNKRPHRAHVTDLLKQYGFAWVEGAIHKGIAKPADNLWSYTVGTLQGQKRDAERQQKPPTSSAPPSPANGAKPIQTNRERFEAEARRVKLQKEMDERRKASGQ